MGVAAENYSAVGHPLVAKFSRGNNTRSTAVFRASHAHRASIEDTTRECRRFIRSPHASDTRYALVAKPPGRREDTRRL